MSLVKTAPGSAKYYTEYVLGGCERPGEWMGQGAKQLGLSGKVDPTHLQNLFKGLHPDGAAPLIKLSAIRKDRVHVPAWDLTVSAPKDVSLLAGLFDEFKDKVDRCQREAVSATTDGRITLNLDLIKVPTHCIEYVVIHELCHIKVMSHKPAFFRLLSQLVPDWERRKQRLNSFIFPDAG